MKRLKVSLIERLAWTTVGVCARVRASTAWCVVTQQLCIWWCTTFDPTKSWSKLAADAVVGLRQNKVRRSFGGGWGHWYRGTKLLFDLVWHWQVAASGFEPGGTRHKIGNQLKRRLARTHTRTVSESRRTATNAIALGVWAGGDGVDGGGGGGNGGGDAAGSTATNAPTAIRTNQRHQPSPLNPP